MSRFNTDYNDLIDQIETLDSKMVDMIRIMKQLQTRVAELESIAKKHGITVKKREINLTKDESCIIM